MLPATTVDQNCDLQRSVRDRVCVCVCVYGGGWNRVEECVRVCL